MQEIVVSSGRYSEHLEAACENRTWVPYRWVIDMSREEEEGEEVAVIYSAGSLRQFKLLRVLGIFPEVFIYVWCLQCGVIDVSRLVNLFIGSSLDNH